MVYNVDGRKELLRVSNKLYRIWSSMLPDEEFYRDEEEEYTDVDYLGNYLQVANSLPSVKIDLETILNNYHFQLPSPICGLIEDSINLCVDGYLGLKEVKRSRALGLSDESLEYEIANKACEVYKNIDKAYRQLRGSLRTI